MSDRGLYTAFGASLLIHLTLVPAASVRLQNNSSVPITIPVKLVDMPRVEEVEEPESFSREPLPKPKAQKITAPKLLSKPEIFKTRSSPTTGNIKEQIKEPEKPVEKLPPLASLRPDPDSLKGGWKSGSEAGDAERSAASNLFGKSDVEIIGGIGLEGGGAGGGGVRSGETLSEFARPLGGYQVKPHYPESARRAGAHGTTLLKLRVLENGKVGEVQIEKSAGHAELDERRGCSQEMVV